MDERRVETPIKSCHECWANYTLTEWNGLELVARADPPGETTGDEPIDFGDAYTVETRTCSKCGAELELDLAGLDDLDLTDNPAQYEAAHPNAERVQPEMLAPHRREPSAPPSEPETKTPTHPPEMIEQIVRASLRRIAPQIAYGIALWIKRCPRLADEYTLGELRALLGRGPL